MFEDLAGRTALVTGGARGLGFSMAQALARQGVAVGLLDVLPEVEESARTLADETGVATAGVHGDVTDAAALDAAFGMLADRLGTADVLVTAAGISSWSPTLEVTAQDWRHVLAVNLDGTLFACQAFARRLLEAGRPGSAVLISSMSGHVVNVPQHQAAYNASKAAVAHLGASLAVEWAASGIRVNSIAPGYFLSDMTRQFTDENPDLRDRWISMIPMGRMGEPEDLHGLVVYLASEASAYLTGQTITIDGGYTAI